MQRAPGTGQSKKARQRRRRTIQTTTMYQPIPRSYQSSPLTSNVSTTVTRISTKNGKTSSRRINRKRRNPRISNDYLKGLMYPEACLGCRVPDLTSIPTATYQLKQTLTQIATSTGLSGLAWSPCTGGGIYQFLDTTLSTAPALVWGTGVAPNGVSGLNSIFAFNRCVNGSLIAEYVGSSGTDSGIVNAYWQVNDAPGTTITSNRVPSSLNNAQSQPYGDEYPVRNGARVLWRPKDNRDAEFVGILNSQTNAPNLIVVCSGLTTGMQIKYTITANFEAIASTDAQSLISTEASPVNSGWLEEGYRWGQQLAGKVTPMFEANSPLRTAAYQLGASVLTNQLRRLTLGNNVQTARAVQYRPSMPLIEEID